MNFSRAFLEMELRAHLRRAAELEEQLAEMDMEEIPPEDSEGGERPYNSHDVAGSVAAEEPAFSGVTSIDRASVIRLAKRKGLRFS